MGAMVPIKNKPSYCIKSGVSKGTNRIIGEAERLVVVQSMKLDVSSASLALES